MGILDGLQFDPASFGSVGPPGWLDMVLPPQPGPGQGFSDQLLPSAIAAHLSATAAPASAAAAPQNAAAPPAPAAAPQDAPPDLAKGAAGTPNPFAALFGGAGPPAFATPPATPSAAPPTTQSPAIGIGDRLGAALTNFANARAFLPALAGAANGLATGQRNDLASFIHGQQTAATQALVRAGLPPALAQAAALNPALLQALASQLMRGPPATTAPRAPLPAAVMQSGGVRKPIAPPST
jgi:hypothetical protein